MITVTSTKRVQLARLTEFPGNARLGDADTIAKSIELHGQYRALVVNERTMQVLAGNHTLRALRKLGEKEGLVSFVDVDEDEAKRINLIDNKLSDDAGYDNEALAGLLGSLPELDGTGYSQKDLDKLLGDLQEDPVDTGPALGGVEYRLLVECDGEEHQAQLLERFEAEGLRVQAIAQ